MRLALTSSSCVHSHKSHKLVAVSCLSFVSVGWIGSYSMFHIPVPVLATTIH